MLTYLSSINRNINPEPWNVAVATRPSNPSLESSSISNLGAAHRKLPRMRSIPWPVNVTKVECISIISSRMEAGLMNALTARLISRNSQPSISMPRVFHLAYTLPLSTGVWRSWNVLYPAIWSSHLVRPTSLAEIFPANLS